jgi:hypothetical protein
LRRYAQGDTYARVNEEAEESKLWDRAEIILELEDSYMKFRRGAKPPGGFEFVLKTLLTLEMPYGDYPRYLHQLNPAQRLDHKQEDTSEQIKVLSDSFAVLSETVELESRRTKERLDQMDKEMHDMHATVKDDLHEILRHLQKSD